MSSTSKYDDLAVTEDADQHEIRAAYRRLAMMHHPDKGGDTAEFQKIQNAYETLGDEDARQQYDHQLRNPDLFSRFSMAGGRHGFDGFGFDADDDNIFEDFIKFSFFQNRRSPASRSKSWFFNFDMNDDEYFRKQAEDRAQRREEHERFAEAERERRKEKQAKERQRQEAAKEQRLAEFLKRRQDKPQTSHKKNLRKNLLKLIAKEAPELNRDQLEQYMENSSVEQLEALRLTLDNRSSRPVCDCVVDVMKSCGIRPSIQKKKTAEGKSVKATLGASASVGTNAQPTSPISGSEFTNQTPILQHPDDDGETDSEQMNAKGNAEKHTGIHATDMRELHRERELRNAIVTHLLDMGFRSEVCEEAVATVLVSESQSFEAALELVLQTASERANAMPSSSGTQRRRWGAAAKRCTPSLVEQDTNFGGSMTQDDNADAVGDWAAWHQMEEALHVDTLGKDEHSSDERKGKHYSNKRQGLHSSDQWQREHFDDKRKGKPCIDEGKGEHDEWKGEHWKHSSDEWKDKYSSDEWKGKHSSDEWKDRYSSDAWKGNHSNDESKGGRSSNEWKGQHAEWKGEQWNHSSERKGQRVAWNGEQARWEEHGTSSSWKSCRPEGSNWKRQQCH